MRRRAVLPGVLPALLLLGAVCPAREIYLPDGGLTPEMGFPAQRNGLRITTHLEKDRFEPGAPIPVTCVLANVGDTPLILERPLAGPGSAPDYTYVTEAGGALLVSSLHSPREGGWRPGRPIDPWVMTLEPGRTHTFSVDLARYYRKESVSDHPALREPHLGEPGRYTVQCLYRNWYDFRDDRVWKGVVAAEPVELEILPSPASAGRE